MINNFLERFILDPNELIAFVFSVLLAIFLGFIIALIYKFTHRTMNYETSFFSTLTLLAPIVTVVMFYIQGDIVLSLGLVGSLSIIRFRTPIKDTRDMVFLFWSIVIGLGAGTFNWIFVIITTIIIGSVVLFFYFIKDTNKLHKEYVLVIGGINEINNKVSQIIKDNIPHCQIRSQEIAEDQWEVVYELRLPNRNVDNLDKIMHEIKSLENINKVSLLAPQLPLPL